VRLCPQGRLLVTRVCLLRGTKKEAASQRRPHQYLVPRPLYPHPRGGIEILRRIVCMQGPIRHGKLNFLDCCKFTTIGAFLRHIVVSSPLSAHYYSIRPKAGGHPHPPIPLGRPTVRSLTFEVTDCVEPRARIRAWGSFSWGEPLLSPEQP
jgi:hypothetical protein